MRIGSPTTRRCVEMVCASPLLKGLDCDLVSAGDDAPSLRAQLLAPRAQVAGLYCADGSCFPTPTGLNPMIT